MISECIRCRSMFRDAPDTAGVCPHCGHENTFDDDEDEYPIGQVTC